MSIEHISPQTNQEIADLHELYEQPAYEAQAVPDYSNPNSPGLDALLDEANGNVIAASRVLMDRMISGDIQ